MVQTTEIEDEISLSDIAQRLWRGRGVILISSFLALSFAIVYLAATAVNISRPITYYVALSGVSKGQYPNGTTFTPNDLLGSDVIHELKKRLSLPLDIDLEDGIFVTYDAPQIEGITKIYREKLSAGGLSQSDIQLINDQYEEQLDTAIKSSLRIDVNYSKMGVDAAAGAAIAKALPEIWSDVYLARFRIMENPRIQNVVLSKTVQDLKSSAAILTADSMLKTMANGLTMIGQDNRLSLLQSDAGFSSNEMKEQIESYRTAYFDVVKTKNFEDNELVKATHLENLKLSAKSLQRNIAHFDETLQSLQDLRTGAMPRQPNQFQQNSGNNSLQVGETAVSAIVALANSASLSDYTKSVLEDRQRAALQLSDVLQEIERASVGRELVLTDEFQQEAVRGFATLVGEYQALLRKAHAKLVSDTGKLYTPTTGPMILKSIFPPRTVLIIVLAITLGGILSMSFVLLRSFTVSSRND